MVHSIFVSHMYLFSKRYIKSQYTTNYIRAIHKNKWVGVFDDKVLGSLFTTSNNYWETYPQLLKEASGPVIINIERCFMIKSRNFTTRNGVNILHLNVIKQFWNIDTRKNCTIVSIEKPQTGRVIDSYLYDDLIFILLFKAQV